MKRKKCNKCNTIKKGVVANRIKRQKKIILTTLEKNMGVITIACKKAGITTKTFYVWRQEDEEFNKEVDEIEWGQKYYVESKLITKIARDDTASIIFYLKCRHPKFKTKSEHEITNSKELEDMRNGYNELIKKIATEDDNKDEITKDTG